MNKETIGQYRIEVVLGRGGMGVVYRGLHEALGRPVAIKALAPELTRQPEFRERFFSEAKTQARLQHPNIVAVYDLIEDGGDYFIVMELVSGVSLDDRLQQLAGRGMDLPTAIGIGGQMLAALDYAHSEGVIHRDIKPSNVLLAAGGRIKLMDFGIALLIGDKRLTASQSAIGTPVYMSPEQILRPREVDHRTDIYSAAVVLYEMLAGRPPFDGETEFGIKKLHVEAPPPDLGALRPELPPGVVQAIGVALSKEPDDRFASAGLFLRALEEAAPVARPSGVSTVASPPRRSTTLDSGRSTTLDTSRPPAPVANAGAPVSSLLERLDRTLGQGRARWLAIGAAGLLVLVLAGVLGLSLGGDRTSTETVTEAPAATPAGSVAEAPAAFPATAPVEGGSLASEPVSRIATVAPAAAQPLAAQDPPPSRPTPAPAPTAAQPPTPKPKKAAAAPPAPPVAQQPPPTTVTEPAAPQEEPAPAEAAPEEAEQGAGANDKGLEQFQEMDDLIDSIERLSKQTSKAYDAEGRDDALLAALDRFHDAATDTRREFHKATGTGLAGIRANISGLWHRNRGGQKTDRRILAIKVEELSRLADAVDREMASHPPGASTRELWQELRSNLQKLSGHF
jgi:eukaryotic-like serine/threonine-protein kinase